jgi:hypothetical protein
MISLKRSRLFTLFVSMAAAAGMTFTTAPSSSASDLTQAEGAYLEALWSLAGSSFTPALSVGPEVGWNMGLEDARPPQAKYYRLWDMKVAWRDVNPERGVFDWSILDRRIAQAESWGAKPIMVMGLTPQWAAADPSAGDDRWGPGTASPPADTEAWREYVRALVQRYGARIGAYEVWNEANLQTFWTGTPAQMAELTRIAAEEIGTSAIVLAPSVTTRLASGPRFTRDLISHLTPLTLSALGGWTIHTYPAAGAGPTVPDACKQRVDDILRWQRALVAIAAATSDMNVLKPIWDTEVNFGLEGPGDQAKKDWSDADGAALLTCTYQDSRALGIAVTAWYEYTAASYDLLGVQMNPGTPLTNAAWAALPSTVGVTNPWIPQLANIVEPTISIEGDRLKGDKDRFVRVSGKTTRLPEGTIVKPWFRFPGQTSFTEGTARVVVQADGTFTWQRKTGKRIAVYFRDNDGKFRSNIDIIASR